MKDKPKIVIVGSGFGGLELAKSLKNKEGQVLVIDRNNYHNFQPLLYQVATGGLEPDSIAYPIRRVFRNNKNISFRMAEVKSVDIDKSSVETSIGEFQYDYLVIATGSTNNFFNFEPQKDKLLTLKTVPDALNMRSYIFQNLEKALAKDRDESIEEIMNIAIVGGGPAGIELAGALAEMKHYVIPKDFPDLDTSRMSINLYEAAPKLLAVMSEEASQKSLEYLKKLGVSVFLNAKVASYDGTTVKMEDGTTFDTDTVIWTAGVKASPIEGLPKDSLVGGNRISVDKINRVKGTKNIFAIGDVAACVTDENPKGLPMLAPVAQQQGRLLAKNIIRLVNKEEPEEFSYFNKGMMATVGRNKAVVDLPKWKFQGFFAWVVWMMVHILSLVGFKNKVSAFIGWASNYINYDRPLGLIIRNYKRK
ncbi:NAD(P)/FAD-dependent oxidoreductase [Aegicerativicinus sediminis]|uniref:NAD(P)/FAD-dependent oxidoreductase n=1 Tax=Aegicerativicinus sediminis TaxID=2893202 RepID=UPI001E33C38C|nr:NAD(P)/FAD-dependent oxidoreductase [Aegicerativicinus sediminis]